MLLGWAILPVETFAFCTAQIELSKPSRVGEEVVGIRMRERSVEREVRLDWVEGYSGRESWAGGRV